MKRIIAVAIALGAFCSAAIAQEGAGQPAPRQKPVSNYSIAIKYLNEKVL